MSTAQNEGGLRAARELTPGSVRVAWSAARDRGPWDCGKWVEIPLHTLDGTNDM